MKSKIVNFSDIKASKDLSIAPKDYIDKEVENEMRQIGKELKKFAELSDGIHPNYELYQEQRVRKIGEDMKGMADLLRERGITVQKLSADYMHQIVDDMTCNLGDVMRKEQEKRESMLLDMHLEKAKEMFNTDFPTKEQRAEAKRWNFHKIYGSTGHAILDTEHFHGLENGKVVVLAGARGTGKSLIWEEFVKRMTEIFPVEQLPLDVLEKNAKKLRTRIRKERNPGIQKSLRKELAELEREIYELK